MKTLNNSVIKAIAKETHLNNHTDALIILAKELDKTVAVEELELIKDEHIKVGYMDDMLSFDRDMLSIEIMIRAEKEYSNFEDIRAAF